MKLKTTLLFLLVGQLILAQDRVQKIDSLLTSVYNSGKLNGNVLIADKGKVVDAQLQFEKNENGEITHLFLLQNGKKTKAEKKK